MKKENLYMISVIVSSSFCSLSPDRLRLSFVTRSSSASMLIPSAGFFSHCSTVHQLARLQLHFFSSSHQLASVNGNTQNLGGAVFQYTPPGAQSTFAPGLSRPRGLAIYHGNLYVATNTLDPVTGNLQSSIIKVSAPMRFRSAAYGTPHRMMLSATRSFIAGHITQSFAFIMKLAT